MSGAAPHETSFGYKRIRHLPPTSPSAARHDCGAVGLTGWTRVAAARSVDVTDLGQRSETPDPLAHLGEVFINFNNKTFQWVDVQLFQLPVDADDRTMLTLLIEHERYGCDYAGGDPGQDPTRHGPYWLERITPDVFAPTDADAEDTQLRAWAEQHAELPDYIRASLESVLHGPLRAVDRVYRLQNLGAAAFHDWGSPRSRL